MGVPTAKNHGTNSTHLSIFELRRPVPSEDENKSGRFELRPLALIGYALSIAWMTVLTWNPAVLLPHMASDGQIHILQGSLFAAVAMFSLVSIPLATLFSSERGCTILSVCTLTALVTAICCLSKPLVPWVCAGIVCFCLVLLWGRLFALLKRKSLLITASCAFMLAGILFVFIFALPSQAARLMTLSLPVLSLVLFHLTWKSQATGLLALHAADELSHIDKHPVHFDTAVSATCNLTMGFITAIASSQYFNQPISLFGGMTVVVAGIVSLGCLFKTARNPAYYFARLFPLCAAVLLTVVGVGGSLLGGIASILLTTL